MNATLTYIVAKGMIYAVKDVAAAGDCALLALRGLNQVDCQQMYAIVGDQSNLHYEVYLGHVMTPCFWVGTVFFLWTSIAFGIKICIHYFNEFQEKTKDNKRDK
jgi:hypothetical protein